MNEEEATAKTKELFGEDSFTELDDSGGMDRYYVGALPKTPGAYTGFMGFSWEEALDFARKNQGETEMKKLTAYLIAAIVGLLIVIGASEVSQGKTRSRLTTAPCNVSRYSYRPDCIDDVRSRVCQNGWRSPEDHVKYRCERWARRIERTYAGEEAARLRQHRRTKRL